MACFGLPDAPPPSGPGGRAQEMSTYQKRCTDLQMSEVSLREQLNTYTEKYEDFQGALAKSSKVFNNFKSEMEKVRIICRCFGKTIVCCFSLKS